MNDFPRFAHPRREFSRECSTARQTVGRWPFDKDEGFVKAHTCRAGRQHRFFCHVW